MFKLAFWAFGLLGLLAYWLLLNCFLRELVFCLPLIRENLLQFFEKMT
jgi:hypothetical protein